MTTPPAPHRPAPSRDVHRIPGSLLVCAVSWVLLGITLLLSRVGAEPTNQNPVAPGVTAAIDTVGDSVAPTNGIWWWVSYLPVLGVVVLLLVGVLSRRQGRARLVLVSIGAVAVVGYAQAGQWHIVPAVLFLILGAGAGLMPGANRYLNPTSATAGG